jgi:enterochelin esterase family protein
MAKAESGLWEATVGPVEGGAYRYVFNVDGVNVADPRNSLVSESNGTVWSLVVVPGSEISDTANVPHGAVASVTYYSTALSRSRRMHVYTPPGYERGTGTYPVLYLLHGMGDCDDSWSSVGRAGFIMDNLIASGKARPMIVVMPAGHTRTSNQFLAPARPGSAPPTDEFALDFETDIRPSVERRYRVMAGARHRAIAGLSMGGFQTLNIAVQRLGDYAYVGVFSSGLFGIVSMGRPGAPAAAPRAGEFPWEADRKAKLDNAALRKGVRLLWFGTGKDDFLLSTTRATVDLFKRHGFAPEYAETEGAHTWMVWRRYLADFAPRLFR